MEPADDAPHGGDGLRVAAELGIPADQVIDLSASLNPVPPPVVDVAGRHLWRLQHYPDAREAEQRLAAEIGVTADRLVLTNGGAEAIAIVASTIGHGTVVEPEFSLYRRHLGPSAGTSGRWRSNPNNPLGTLADPTDQAAVWDEAYWPMTVGTWTRGDDEAWRLGSLTKLWACPGLRLGYVIAPSPDAAAAVRRAQPRWSVNALALAVLPELVEHRSVALIADEIARRRRRFADELASIGFEVRPGVAPWLLLDRTEGLRSRLAPSGIVVRDCGSYGLHGVHRVALPPDGTEDRVLTALAAARS